MTTSSMQVKKSFQPDLFGGIVENDYVHVYAKFNDYVNKCIASYNLIC